MNRALVVAATLLGAGSAVAEPLDLELRAHPTPRSLAMRTAAVDPPGAAQDDEPPEPASTAPEPLELDDPDSFVAVRRDDDDLPPLADQLVVRVDAGIAVDGARTSGLPTLDGVQPPDPHDAVYRSVRTYGFGDAYLGSRGVGAASLNTYLAAQTRIARTPEVAPPILTAHDRTTNILIRSAWVESDELFAQKWLAPIRARAGRMFLYGPAVIHLDGLVLAWEGRWFEISTFSGVRVPMFRSLSVDDVAEDEALQQRGGVVSGSEIRADLRRFDLPLIVGFTQLRHLELDHSDLAATLVPRPDIVIRSNTRFSEGALARQRLVVRARISEVTTVIVDSQLRTTADWFWDHSTLAVAQPEGRTVELDAAARRYLDLGPVRPRFQTAVQAGTVLKQNVDLLARGAVALDVDRDAGEDDVQRNPHLPAYIEGGVGVEVRLRRALALQSTFLIRDYQRPVPGVDVVDEPGVPQPSFPSPAATGEEYLLEGGVAIRYTAGARRFSTQAELYLRQTRWAPVYLEDSGEEIAFIDAHGGGRFQLDAWVNPRVRLRGEYDLSTLVDTQPEFRGIKTLRLLVEGTY